MNRAIRFTALFALLLTVVLLVNLTIVQAFRQDEYANNALNRRAYLALQEIQRGQISAQGEVLASSVQDEDGLYSRQYASDATVFANATGYLSEIYGAAGIESSYNGVLNGTELTSSQWWESLTGSQEGGDNVELTLIPSVQRVAYQQLVDNGYEGAVVAIRPSTGEILALASTPTYDPAAISDPDTAESAWEEVTSDDGDPLLDHATQETLPPGSTFKIITTAAALQNGYTANSMLTGESSITLPGTTQTLTNYSSEMCNGSTSVTLLTAFAHSCNTAFAEIGMDIGADALREAAEAFGVGETYDLGLPNAAGSLGDLEYDAQVGQSAIGQLDVSMSALQAAIMAATVANDGLRMEPHIVSQITAPDLSVVDTVEPEEVTQAISADIADQITELMRASEQNTSYTTGQDIASKTGTAEHGDGLAPHVWYVAFAPTEDADVAVAVVVKNGGNQGTSATGGSVASPIGRTVLNAALEATDE